MRYGAWILVGWLGMVILDALGARLNLAHVMPDWPALVLAFLSLRRGPAGLCSTAFVLGYLLERTALAPVGLHEYSLVFAALIIYLVSGHLSGSGGVFLGLSAMVTTILHEVTAALLLWWQRGTVGFSSWATALLLPEALTTALLGVVCYGLMQTIERRLTPDKHEGLMWRS